MRIVAARRLLCVVSRLLAMPDDWTSVVGLLRGNGIDLAEGLTETEFDEVESRLGFVFSPGSALAIVHGCPGFRRIPQLETCSG